MKRRGAAVAAAIASTCLVAAVAPAHSAVPAGKTKNTEARRYLSGWMPYWSMSTASTSFLTNSDLFRDVSPFWHDARWNGSKVYIHDHLS